MRHLPRTILSVLALVVLSLNGCRSTGKPRAGPGDAGGGSPGRAPEVLFLQRTATVENYFRTLTPLEDKMINISSKQVRRMKAQDADRTLIAQIENGICKKLEVQGRLGFGRTPSRTSLEAMITGYGGDLDWTPVEGTTHTNPASKEETGFSSLHQSESEDFDALISCRFDSQGGETGSYRLIFDEIRDL